MHFLVQMPSKEYREKQLLPALNARHLDYKGLSMLLAVETNPASFTQRGKEKSAILSAKCTVTTLRHSDSLGQTIVTPGMFEPSFQCH